MKRLENKIVLITGAARGIGRACALRAADEGADLILTDIGQNLDDVPYSLASVDQLNKTAELCRSKGAIVLTEPGDVRDFDAVKHVVDSGVRRFGKIDVLVNNAGIGAPAGKMTHLFTEAEWRIVMEVNVFGPFHYIKATAATMIEQESGSIINIASTAGILGYKYFSTYSTSKHAVVGLTRSAALDYARNKIRVNAICPGPVEDDESLDGNMTRVVADSLGLTLSEEEAIDLQSVAMKEVNSPFDVANAMLWLASDESRQVTGTTTVIDAGYSIK